MDYTATVSRVTARTEAFLHGVTDALVDPASAHATTFANIRLGLRALGEVRPLPGPKRGVPDTAAVEFAVWYGNGAP